MAVLLHNASGELLSVISRRRAIRLLETGKAIRMFAEKIFRIKLPEGGEYLLPQAVMLVNYVYVPYHAISSNRPSRRNIFQRDKWTCQYCGKITQNHRELTLDHVTPKSHGGDSSWTNLVSACPKCNQRKGNRTPKQANMKLLNKPQKPNYRISKEDIYNSRL